MINRNLFILFALLLTAILVGCEFTKKTVNNVNLFTLEDDIKLGKQVSDQIASDPAQFPILHRWR